MTKVSVMPRKVTVKIGDAENRCRGCEIKIDEKGQKKKKKKKKKKTVRLVLSRVPFKSGI